MDILFDRCLNFIDEVEEIMQERGGQTRSQTIASVHAAFLPPGSRASEESEDQKLRALKAAVARHEAEVEAPALATLRDRKAAAAASRTTSSGWRKEPVTFDYPGAGYYRKLLDCVDPVLPQQLAAAPAVNSLTLRVSWLPRHCAASGFIASSHENLLALYLCSSDSSYSGDRRHLPGCYLVLNTRARSVAVVPPVPAGWVSFYRSHCPIGSAGVAVLRTDAHDDGGGYVLAELYRHTC